MASPSRDRSQPASQGMVTVLRPLTSTPTVGLRAYWRCTTCRHVSHPRQAGSAGVPTSLFRGCTDRQCDGPASCAAGLDTAGHRGCPARGARPTWGRPGGGPFFAVQGRSHQPGPTSRSYTTASRTSRYSTSTPCRCDRHAPATMSATHSNGSSAPRALRGRLCLSEVPSGQPDDLYMALVERGVRYSIHSWTTWRPGSSRPKAVRHAARARSCRLSWRRIHIDATLGGLVEGLVSPRVMFAHIQRTYFVGHTGEGRRDSQAAEPGFVERVVDDAARSRLRRTTLALALATRRHRSLSPGKHLKLPSKRREALGNPG